MLAPKKDQSTQEPALPDWMKDAVPVQGAAEPLAKYVMPPELVPDPKAQSFVADLLNSSAWKYTNIALGVPIAIFAFGSGIWSVVVWVWV
jgi:hypothetical protein